PALADATPETPTAAESGQVAQRLRVVPVGTAPIMTRLSPPPPRKALHARLVPAGRLRSSSSPLPAHDPHPARRRRARLRPGGGGGARITRQDRPPHRPQPHPAAVRLHRPAAADRGLRQPRRA